MMKNLKILKHKLKGELHFNETHRIIYSTDASAYKEKPLAVAFPKDIEDVREIISFVSSEKKFGPRLGVEPPITLSIIPRGAGTSLAGQVTGKGIIVDVSKYMN